MHPELDHDKLEKMQQSKDESKSSLSKLWSGFKSGLKSAASGLKHMKNYVLGESSKQEPSLSMYLDDYFKLLTGTTPLNSTTPVEIVYDIVYIFQSLYKYYFYFDGMSHLVFREDIKKVCNYVNNASCTQLCFGSYS